MQIERVSFMDAILELENAGVITTDAHGDVYGHVLWADVALGRLSESIAHNLHRYAAECLDQEFATAPTSALLWESARHWHRAGQSSRARDAIIRGAQHLVEHGFPSEAAKVYGEAETYAVDAQDRLALLRRRIDLLYEGGSVRLLVEEIDRHERTAIAENPAYDRHNNLEMLRAFASYKEHGDTDATLEAMLSCARDTNASSSHRLRAAKEAARVATFSLPDAFPELQAIVRDVPRRTDDDTWNAEFVDYCFHSSFGNPLEAVAIAEAWTSRYRYGPMRGRYSVALHKLGDAYWLAGRIGDARATIRASLNVNRESGLIGHDIGAYDLLIALVIEFDPPQLARKVVEEAKDRFARLVALGGLAEGSRFVNHEARLALAEENWEESLRLVAPLDQALASPVPRWRSQWLAVHLVARRALGDDTRTDEIVASLKACFRGRNHWMEWPAAILAEYLWTNCSLESAKEFAAHYMSECRIELAPPPPIIAELLALEV